MLELKAMSEQDGNSRSFDGADGPLLDVLDASDPEAFFIPRDFNLGEINLRLTSSERHTTRAGRANVESTLESPLAAQDKVPLLYIPGYQGIKPAYYQARTHTARYGRRAISFKVDRWQEWLADFHPKHALHPERLHVQAVKGIMDFYSQLYGFEQYDLSGHSMGGWIAALVAERWPHLVRSVILDASAGLEPHNALTLAPRLPLFAFGELIPGAINGRLGFENLSLRKVALQGLLHSVINPYRTASEGLAVSRCDVRPKLTTIREKGIKTAIVGYGSDRLLPVSKMYQHARHLVDEFIVFPINEAGHLGPQGYPAEVAQLHVDLLNYWFASTNQDKLPQVDLEAVEGTTVQVLLERVV